MPVLTRSKSVSGKSPKKTVSTKKVSSKKVSPVSPKKVSPVSPKKVSPVSPKKVSPVSPAKRRMEIAKILAGFALAGTAGVAGVAEKKFRNQRYKVDGVKNRLEFLFARKKASLSVPSFSSDLPGMPGRRMGM
jgi:hypothetical protein